MATFRGIIARNDLEGGFWELHSDDGVRYGLRGGSDDLLVAGQRVEIQGQVDNKAFGIGMTGPYLDVQSWTKAGNG